jgi:pyruvate/2-oxoglutarate dehydrogenase complex dihydrolipoamide dehydrogenase (E3) component
MPSTSPITYTSLILGSGQAATPLALHLSSLGERVALIEKCHIGGCCVNVGCTPTKTMIASGRVAYLTRRGVDYGVSTGNEEGRDGGNEVVVDMKQVRERKRDIVKSFRGGSEKRLEAAGVDVIIGEGKFIGKRLLSVKTKDGEEKIFTASNIFINVGERPSLPSTPGIENINPALVLDSTSIQELDAVPGHLVVVGGGYVGLEFAQLMRRLGAEVTVSQRGKQLLPREDADVAEEMRKILVGEGLRVELESEAVEVESAEDGAIEIQVRNNGTGSISVLTATHILYAAGRIPNTNTLNLSAAGIKTNSKGYIESNEFLETTAKDVFVMGDVKGPPAFTHISYDDFRILKHNLTPTPKPLMERKSITNRLIPYVVYTDPQLGHIGLHHHEALKIYPERNIKTASMPMSYVARALETDETRGMMKAVIDGDSGEILGFTSLGIEGGEVMSVVQMAMVGGQSYEVLRDAVWAHPSLAESLNNLWGFLK